MKKQTQEPEIKMVSGLKNAEWIWSQDLKKTAYFRKTFQMTAALEKTFFIFDGDSYAVYLNGKLIKGIENGREAQIVAVDEDLAVGENVIAVQSAGKSWGAGFFACLCRGNSLQGYEILLITDTSWKCSDQIFKDWYCIDFDDSNWSSACKVRDFLKDFAEARNFPDLEPLSSKDASKLGPARLVDAKMMELSNERLSLILEYTSRQAAFQVKDNLTQELWFMPGPPFIIDGSIFDGIKSAWDGLPVYQESRFRLLDDSTSAWDGRVNCEKTDQGLRVTTTDFKDYPDLIVTYTLSLKGNQLEIILEPLQGLPAGRMVKVAFPLDFGAVQGQDDGYLVNSFAWSGGGRLFPFQPYFDQCGFRHKLKLTVEPHLPFYGVVRHGHPCATVLANSAYREYALQTVVDNDRRGLKHIYSITPVWFVEAGRMNEPRRLVYNFLESGGYVETAKVYRSFLIKTGRYKTLRERVARHPVCNLIVNASFFWCVYPLDKLPEFMARLKARGVDKAVFHVANRNDFVGGWKRWPEGMSTIYNTAKEFKHTADFARKMGYGFSPVEEFTVIADRGELYDERMRVMTRNGACHYWSLEQCFSICESQKLRFAQDELPRVKQIIGECPYLLDVEGCNLYECFNPDHPLSFHQAVIPKRDYLTFIKETFGCVASEGPILDFLTDIIDVNHGCAIGSGYWGENTPGVLIPLWSLVYTGSMVDAIVIHSHESEAVLYALLYGSNPRIDFNEFIIGGEARRVHTSDFIFLEGAVACHKKIAAAWPDRNYYELMDHEYLAPFLQKSKFQDGDKTVEVIANFGDAECKQEGHIIPPNDFIIIKSSTK